MYEFYYTEGDLNRVFNSRNLFFSLSMQIYFNYSFFLRLMDRRLLYEVSPALERRRDGL